MGLTLYLLVLAVFLALVVRFRHSAAIIPLAIAGWIGAYFWNGWILSTCSGDCNIRVDLVLIAPLVLAATLFAVIRAVRQVKQ